MRVLQVFWKILTIKPHHTIEPQNHISRIFWFHYSANICKYMTTSAFCNTIGPQILNTFLPLAMCNSVARAFLGGWVAHPEGKNEEENEQSLRKDKKNWLQFEEKWGKWNSCPPGTVRLATALAMWVSYYTVLLWPLQVATVWGYCEAVKLLCMQ